MNFFCNFIKKIKKIIKKLIILKILTIKWLGLKKDKIIFYGIWGVEDNGEGMDDRFIVSFVVKGFGLLEANVPPCRIKSLLTKRHPIFCSLKRKNTLKLDCIFLVKLEKMYYIIILWKIQLILFYM